MSHDHSERSTSTEKVPHSGRLPEDMRETPVREFDNTPLLEAHEQGLLEAPDSANDLLDTGEIDTHEVVDESPNRKTGRPRKGLIAGAVGTAATAALAIILGAGITAANDDGKKPPETGQGNELVVPGQGGEVKPNTEEFTPITDPIGIEANYIVHPESIAKMSDEELKDLATITVDSVTGADGKIDWSLVSQKTSDIIEIIQMSGVNRIDAERMTVERISERDQSLRYSNLMLPQLIQEGVDVSWIREPHEGLLKVARISYLDEKNPIYFSANTVGASIVNSNDTSATIDITARLRDNFFSSGTLSASIDRDVQFVGGRTADMDKVETGRYSFLVVDGGRIMISAISSP